MRRALLALALFPLLAANAPPVPMSDPELAAERGGFALPGGLEVTIAVTTLTQVDGQTVMQSVYRVDEAAKLSVTNALGQRSALDGRDGITVVRRGAADLIQFDGDRLSVGHLVGGAYGTVLQNNGDNRSIELLTTIDLHVAGATADLLGSAALRAEALALESTARLAR